MTFSAISAISAISIYTIKARIMMHTIQVGSEDDIRITEMCPTARVLERLFT